MICGPRGEFFDLGHQGAHTVMNAEALAGDHFFARHGAFGAHFQSHGQPERIDRLNHAADDLAQLLLVVGKLGLALRIADALLDHLAGGLRGHAAKIARRAFHNHHAAQFGIRVITLRFGQRHFGAVILHRLNHFLFGRDGDLAGFHVDFGFHLLCVRSIYSTAISRNHRRFKRLDDDVSRQLFFFQNLVESQDKLVLHSSPYSSLE